MAKIPVGQEAFIVTADDDVYYWSSWLELLVAGVELPAKIVTCHWADEIIADAQGRYLPYRQWVPNTSFRGKAPTLVPSWDWRGPLPRLAYWPISPWIGRQLLAYALRAMIFGYIG